jgi:hypothetical protein
MPRLMAGDQRFFSLAEDIVSFDSQSNFVQAAIEIVGGNMRLGSATG